VGHITGAPEFAGSRTVRHHSACSTGAPSTPCRRFLSSRAVIPSVSIGFGTGSWSLTSCDMASPHSSLLPLTVLSLSLLSSLSLSLSLSRSHFHSFVSPFLFAAAADSLQRDSVGFFEP
jgi:hypothetical protein